jgi:methionyl aminopeptidase
MIKIKTKQEIEIMRRGGEILARVLNEVAEEAKPGISLKQLDSLAEKLIIGFNARSSFKGYKPIGSKKAFPATLCISLNHEVVHGVPDDRIFKNGDIVSLDLGVFYNGYHTDSAVTVGVGKISDEAKRLIYITRGSLDLAIDMCASGIYWGDIASEMQKYIEEAGFSVVKELTGHGVGRDLQEDPFLANYGKKGDDPILKEGMVIAIEPMVAMNKSQVETGIDGFVYQTRDKSLAAHFEHTLAITKSGVRILTKL